MTIAINQKKNQMNWDLYPKLDLTNKSKLRELKNFSKKSQNSLVDSMNDWLSLDVDKRYSLNCSIPSRHEDFIYTFDEKLKSQHLGFLDETFSNKGSVFSVSYYLLKTIFKCDIDILDLLSYAQNYGFYEWYFPFQKNRSGYTKILNDSSLNLDVLKSYFLDDKEFQSCYSLSQVIHKYGRPTYYQISEFYLDYIIGLAYDDFNIKIVEDTRVKSFNHLLLILESGFPVIAKISDNVSNCNSIDSRDHFVIIISIYYGEVTIIDPECKQFKVIDLSKFWGMVSKDKNRILLYNTNPNIRAI